MSMGMIGGAVIGGAVSAYNARKARKSNEAMADQANAAFNLQAPYLSDVYGSAQDLYNTNRSLVPSMDRYTTMGLEGTAGAVQDYMIPFAQQAQGAAGYFMDPSRLDVMNDPMIQQQLQQMEQSGLRRLQEQYLPAVDQGAVATGNVGGSRQGVLQANAMRDTQEAVTNAQQDYLMNQYNARANQMMNAAQMAPGLNAAMLTPYAALTGVGQAYQDYDAARAADPWTRLQQYYGIIGGTGAQQSQAITPTPTQNPISGAIGGAALGSSLWNQFQNSQQSTPAGTSHSPASSFDWGNTLM